jgi:hypothetical protein
VQASERNAVMWGVFPGQEFVQSTIIEQESYLTWKVRIVSPLCPSGVLIDIVAGRGVLDLDKLGVSFRAGLRGARAAEGNQRYTLAGQRHTPRLQRPRCVMEVFIRSHWPGRLESDIITAIRHSQEYLHVVPWILLPCTGSYVGWTCEGRVRVELHTIERLYIHRAHLTGECPVFALVLLTRTSPAPTSSQGSRHQHMICATVP